MLNYTWRIQWAAQISNTSQAGGTSKKSYGIFGSKMTMVYVILAAVTVVLILVVIGAAVIWNGNKNTVCPGFSD